MNAASVIEDSDVFFKFANDEEWRARRAARSPRPPLAEPNKELIRNLVRDGRVTGNNDQARAQVGIEFGREGLIIFDEAQHEYDVRRARHRELKDETKSWTEIRTPRLDFPHLTEHPLRIVDAPAFGGRCYAFLTPFEVVWRFSNDLAAVAFRLKHHGDFGMKVTRRGVAA